jgi:hypothetical protein
MRNDGFYIAHVIMRVSPSAVLSQKWSPNSVRVKQWRMLLFRPHGRMAPNFLKANSIA